MMDTVSSTPWQSYQGTRFTPFGTDIMGTVDPVTGQRVGGALNLTRNAVGMGQGPQGTYNQALSTAGNVANRSFGPIQGGNLITGGGPGTPQLSQYMNQYDQGVIDKVGQDFAKAKELGLRNVGSQAHASRAFGGSRHGVQEALSDEANTQNYLGTVAGLRQAGFNQAADRMSGDLNRGLQSKIASGNLGLGTGQLNLAGAGQQAALQDTARRAAYGDAQALQQIGLLQQAQGQRQEDFNFAQHQAEQQNPARMLALRQSILGGLPYNQQTTATKQQTKNPLTAILGGGLGGLGAAGMAGQIGGAGAVAGLTPVGWGLIGGGALLGAMS
tara:strand:- start:13247 stop:14233 length:987 start_codon:yes stop_codon:yes gene_type:complete